MPRRRKKSFAAFRSLHALRLIKLFARARARLSPGRSVRSGRGKRASSVAMRPSARRSALARRSSSEKKRATHGAIGRGRRIKIALAIDRGMTIVPAIGQIRRVRRIVQMLRSGRVLRTAQVPQTVQTRQSVRSTRNIRCTPTARISPKAAARVLVGIIAVACAPLLRAQVPEAQQFFEQGRAAFERQDYPRALAAFEAALAAHLDGPAIHFNIGVAAYRAGAYERARAAFERAALTPSMATLAHYNLGLVALAQHDEQRAIDEFVRVYADSDDAQLRALAREQLDSIGSAPPPRRDVAWAAYASTGIGYDDNVTLTSSGQSLGFARRGDVYSDTLLAASLQLTDAWRIDADASLLKYRELSDFDQWGVGAGARYRFGLAPWTLDVGTQLGTTYLDGERFDVRESVYLQGVRMLGRDYVLRARYRLTHVDGSDDYPGFGGSSHELTGRLTRQLRTWTAGVIYTFELNDYDSAALSAMRHRLMADVRVPLSRAWAARASLAYRHSDYEAAEFGAERRIDVGATAELRVSERWMVALQYVFTDADADVPAFSYRRNRVFLGVEAGF